MVTYLEKRQAMSQALTRCINCFRRAGLTNHEIALHLEGRVVELAEIDRRKARTVAQRQRGDAETSPAIEDPRR